ncbi:MAG: porin [Nitrospiraceae bacterium]|nr:porin [Nitrospiraceae bacterium]
MMLLASIMPAYAGEVPPVAAEAKGVSDWHYGGFVDLSYTINFNFPENHLWRSRTTVRRHNELAPNMAVVYVRKDLSAESHWGMELGLQGGYDSKDFAFLKGEKEVAGADTLRHVHRANVSYLAPLGKGLTVTAGLFNSLIGYESLYARDNSNYTRSWIADNTPYMMFGAKASYPVSDEFTATLFAINSYYHLAHPNNQPSYGVQGAWKPTSRFTLTETFYAGPDQTDADLKFWRTYLSSTAEWKGEEVSVALSYDIGTENIAGRLGDPRAFVMGGALFTRWNVSGPWSLAVRPEFYWDRNGRWTGNEQFVKAITSTVEYKLALAKTTTLFRLEHRFDESTGAGGGFFNGGDVSPGVPGLTAGQQLFLLSLILSFDS